MAAAILSVTGVFALHAQDTRESAAAGLRAVDPKEMDPDYKNGREIRAEAGSTKRSRSIPK